MNGFLFASPSGNASWCLMVVWRSKVSDEVFAESSQSALVQSIQESEHLGISTAEKHNPSKSQTSQAGEVSGPRHSEKLRTSCVSSKLHTLNPSPRGSRSQGGPPSPTWLQLQRLSIKSRVFEGELWPSSRHCLSRLLRRRSSECSWW